MAFVLIGFMGAGKSTVAVELAAELRGTALDSDALLEEQFGQPLAREFELHGEEAFRAAEEELVCRLLREAGEHDVVALGGGSVLSAQVREALREHTAILLDVDAEEAWERVGDPAGGRPLAREQGAFTQLHGERSALYEQLADAILVGLPRAGVAGVPAALRALARAPAGTRLLWASAASGAYPVLIASGLLAGGAEPASPPWWPLERERSRAFCVSDETVLALYGGCLGELAASIAIAPGEQHKTLASAERVWQGLLEAGMTRADHVIALGGGVVGDLAGFCAATYQRGVPVVQVPSTLVAQVDSAYGGKTGVDLPAAKNYVGAYHQPAGVIVDPDLLATLAPAERAAGWVEVLKTALIAGGTLWQTVAAGSEVDDAVILACARTKLAIVAADERDGGRRQVLNLGHTVGHAIETVTGYGRYRHGEAIGLGLLVALRLSGRDDLRMQVHDLLAERGLPVTADGLRADEILEALARDKKRLAGEVPFVLVEAPGEVRHGCLVAPAELRTAVQEILA
jgi:shikimate kinase / 3-dehydroquinate synthase